MGSLDIAPNRSRRRSDVQCPSEHPTCHQTSIPVAGYVNADLAFGTTIVEPVAVAMKSAGGDGVTTGVDSKTSFALVQALRQFGVNLKGALMVTGYGYSIRSMFQRTLSRPSVPVAPVAKLVKKRGTGRSPIELGSRLRRLGALIKQEDLG